MTQHEIIIRELKRRWLTPMDALEVAGTMKLATRLCEVRDVMMYGKHSMYWSDSNWCHLADTLCVEGYRITDKWVETSTGKKVKAYRLVKA